MLFSSLDVKTIQLCRDLELVGNRGNPNSVQALGRVLRVLVSCCLARLLEDLDFLDCLLVRNFVDFLVVIGRSLFINIPSTFDDWSFRFLSNCEARGMVQHCGDLGYGCSVSIGVVMHDAHIVSVRSRCSHVLHFG